MATAPFRGTLAPRDTVESKRTSVALWIVTGLCALMFVVTGSSKLFAVPPSPQNFARWGFSHGFMLAIGAIEVVGGIALLWPRIAAVAAFGLIATMLGAVRTGLVFHEAMHVALPGVLIVLLAAIAYGRRAPLLRMLGRSAG